MMILDTPPVPSAYFQRLDSSTFCATSAVQGAWNVEEQHIAPSLGLLVHLLEKDRDRRRGRAPLTLSRVSFDILGTIPFEDVTVATHVVRPGRTIELSEATLSHGGRAALVARAWALRANDTADLEGGSLPRLAPPERFEEWSASAIWPGAHLASVDIRREQDERGRARFWMRPRLPLLSTEPISDTARLVGMIDLANGITPRHDPSHVAFPNVDLTVHLFRAPRTVWIGFDTTVSTGPGGIGMTHTILHDEEGPIGVSVQTLTVRPRRDRR